MFPNFYFSSQAVQNKNNNNSKNKILTQNPIRQNLISSLQKDGLGIGLLQ